MGKRNCNDKGKLLASSSLTDSRRNVAIMTAMAVVFCAIIAQKVYEMLLAMSFADEARHTNSSAFISNPTTETQSSLFSGLLTEITTILIAAGSYLLRQAEAIVGESSSQLPSLVQKFLPDPQGFLCTASQTMALVSAEQKKMASFFTWVSLSGILCAQPTAASIAQTQFPSTFSLADLNLGVGFNLTGELTGNQAGSVTELGDINNDGFDDIGIGAPGANGAAGTSYVVFGTPGISDLSAISLSSLNGTTGFKIFGISPGDQSSIRNIGDVNGDGIADIGFGAVGGNNGTGAVYVVFGGKNIGLSGSLLLSSLNGTSGFNITGVSKGAYTGFSVSKAGDFNGDGHSDFIIGSYMAGGGAGASYLIYGGPTIGSSGSLQLSALNGTNGFNITDVLGNERSGISVSYAGDVNGDKHDDLIIGGYWANNVAGAAYVIFGSPDVGKSGTLLLSRLNGTNGFNITSSEAGAMVGRSVSCAGDVNGDGFGDLIIGGYRANNTAGVGYLLLGGPNVGSSGAVLLSNLNGSNGFKIMGVSSNDYTGHSVSALDFNGDGFSDLLLGAYGANAGAGVSYLLLGGPDVGTSGVVLLSNLNGINGFKMTGGAAGGHSGVSVSRTGDVNHDGISDFLIGAPDIINGGASYLILGDAISYLTANEFSITQGESIRLNSSYLNATYVNTTRNSMIRFTFSNIQHGYFSLASAPSTPVTSVIQQFISNGSVYFTHDGSNFPPTFNTTIGTGGLATMSPQPASITFVNATTTTTATTTTIPSTSTTTNFPPPVVSQPGLELIVTGANKFQLISAASSVSVTLQLARAIGRFMTTVAGLPPVRFTADPLLNTLTMTGSPTDINTALNKLRFSLNDGNEAFDQAAVRISASDGSSTVSDVGTLARFGSNRAPGPTGYGYANTTINLNTQFTIDFSTLMPNPFADPDGDPMTYLLMLVNGQSLLSSGMQFINGKVLGGLFLRPDVYEFDVLATDGYKTSQFSVRFQLTGGYLPPFLNKLIGSVTVDVGVPVSIGIDPKTFVGNGLTYFANRDIAGLDYPLPSYLLFDSVSLQLRGVMPADETLNVTVGAKDLYGSIVTTWFLLRAFDVPPRLLRPIVDQMAIALQRLVISIPHDTFNSSKPLGYSLTALSNGDPLPAWVVWNENTKEVVAIPNKDALGQNFTLRLTASDGYKSSALNITLVVPSNQPPYIMRDLQSAIAIAGQLFNYPFDDAFKSPMNYSLSFSIAPDDNVTVLPGWSSLSPINALYGTPTDGDIGSFRVRVSVDDGLGGVASQVVSITVERSLIASILYYGQFAAAIGGPILTAWGAYRNRAQFYNFFKGRGTEIECPFYNTKKCKLNESGELSYNIKGNKKEKKNDAYPHAKYLNVYRKLAPGESGCIERALPRLFAFSHYLGRQFGLVELAWGSASPAWMNFDKEQGILTIEVDKLDEQPVTLIITTIDGLILSQFEVDPLKIKLIYKEEIAAYLKKKNNAVTKTQEQHEGSPSAKVVSLKKTHGQSQKKESSTISNGAARNLTKVGDWELSLLSTSSSSKAGRSRSALRLLETASNKEKKDEKPKRVSSSTAKKQPLPIFLAQDSKQESSESRESSGGSGSGKQRSSSSDLNRSLLDSRGHSFPLSPKTSLTNVTDFFRKFSDDSEEAVELRCVSSSVRTKKAVESKPVSSSIRTKEEKKKFDLLSASETRKSSTSSASRNQGLSLNKPGLFSRSSSDAIKKQAGEQFSKKNKNEPRINRVA